MTDFINTETNFSNADYGPTDTGTARRGDWGEGYSFPPLGSRARPGDIRRGHRAVRDGLDHVVSDVESYLDVLRAAFEEFTLDERVTERGRAISTALDQTWVLLGVLKGALSLCPRELTVRPPADKGE